MKKISLILYFISFAILANSQENHDNTWILNNDDLKEFIHFNWKNDTPKISLLKSNAIISVGANTSVISDRKGNFKYLSNGCLIAGKDLYPLPNGKGINPGYVHDVYCGDDGALSYPTANNTVFLPNPNDTSKYYLIHTARVGFDDTISGVAYPFYKMYYSEIDATKGTKGAVSKKNMPLGPEEFISEMGPVACRHANGKDWWVVIAGWHNSFHRIFIDSTGVKYIGKQKFSEQIYRNERDWAGQAIFSPDGKKYVRSDPFNGTVLYDFDRCTGLLSNPFHIDTILAASCSGIAISPNNQFLYITNTTVLHQFDLLASDILASKTQIATLDINFMSQGTYCTFYKCLLAPDNKIYIASTNSMDYLNVIHNPNKKGEDCDFRQHDLKLPKRNYVGLPNMPNYRLAAMNVSCPPVIATDEKFEHSNILVFPNPAINQITIQNNAYSYTPCLFTLFDLQGRQVFTKTLQQEKENIALDLPHGIYFWHVYDENRQIGQGKLIIIE